MEFWTYEHIPTVVTSFETWRWVLNTILPSGVIVKRWQL